MNNGEIVRKKDSHAHIREEYSDALPKNNSKVSSENASKKQRVNYIHWLTPALWSAIGGIIVFIAQYMLYRRYQIDEMRYNADLHRVQSEVSELDKTIKSIDSKFSEEMYTSQLKSHQAEIVNKQINSELARLQVQLSEIDLATRQQQRNLEAQRDSASTAEIMAQFQTNVRPAVDFKCKGEFVSSDTFVISCDLKNIGIYPVKLKAKLDSPETSGVFWIDGGSEFRGVMQPKQQFSSSVTVKFYRDFMRVHKGTYVLELDFHFETLGEIVDTILQNVKSRKDKDIVKSSSAYDFRQQFGVRFE